MVILVNNYSDATKAFYALEHSGIISDYYPMDGLHFFSIEGEMKKRELNELIGTTNYKIINKHKAPRAKKNTCVAKHVSTNNSLFYDFEE